MVGFILLSVCWLSSHICLLVRSFFNLVYMFTFIHSTMTATVHPCFIHVISSFLSGWTIESTITGCWFQTFFYVSIYWEFQHPNWLSLHHFSEGEVWPLQTSLNLPTLFADKFGNRSVHPAVKCGSSSQFVRFWLYPIILSNPPSKI